MAKETKARKHRLAHTSFNLSISADGRKTIDLAISSPKVANELIAQLKKQGISAEATSVTTKKLSTEDK